MMLLRALLLAGTLAMPSSASSAAFDISAPGGHYKICEFPDANSSRDFQITLTVLETYREGAWIPSAALILEVSEGVGYEVGVGEPFRNAGLLGFQELVASESQSILESSDRSFAGATVQLSPGLERKRPCVAISRRCRSSSLLLSHSTNASSLVCVRC